MPWRGEKAARRSARTTAAKTSFTSTAGEARNSKQTEPKNLSRVRDGAIRKRCPRTQSRKMSRPTAATTLRQESAKRADVANNLLATPAKAQKHDPGPEVVSAPDLSVREQLGLPSLHIRHSAAKVESPSNPRQICVNGELRDNPFFETLPLPARTVYCNPRVFTIIDGPLAAQKMDRMLNEALSIGDEKAGQGERTGGTDPLLVRPKTWALPEVNAEDRKRFTENLYKFHGASLSSL